MADFIDPINNNNKIFVSIACFMDNDIINTIDECLVKAKYPENIIFGVCLQYDPSDNFFEKYDNHPQVKVVKMPYNEAKGPAYARGLIYDLFRDEDYFFQIDCHTRFFQYWDDKIINHYTKCCSIYPKVVISHYPININNMNNEEHSKQIAHISTVRCIDVRHGIKTHGRFINSNSPPKESYGISAAMLFFDKNTYYTVPFDKEIYNGLQFEEQTVLAARYWTHGYNIYQMNEHVIATEYITNTKRYNVRPSTNPILKQNTHDKLYHIMKLKYDGKYVNNTNSLLGTERTIEDYYRFLQIYDTVVSTYPNNYLNNNEDESKNVNDLNYLCESLYDISISNDKNIIQGLIINMTSAPQKYSAMSNKLTMFEIPHKRFNGIIGTDIYESFKNNNKFLNNGYTLRPHQIGCWQSHYIIWKKMVEEKIDKLFIFEDDCSFVNDFKELYKNTLNLLKDKEYDIIFLGYSGCSVDINNDFHLTPDGCPRCLHSYILSLNGAKKMIERMTVIDYPIDETIGRMFHKKELIGFRSSYILSYQPWQKRKDKYPLPKTYINDDNYSSLV